MKPSAPRINIEPTAASLDQSSGVVGDQSRAAEPHSGYDAPAVKAELSSSVPRRTSYAPDSQSGILVPGKQLTACLRLVRALGEGGMGRVWVAEHTTLATEVAVKLLNPDLAQDEQWLVRFRREAQAIARIDSAHVVRVFDHGISADNIPYIVMELLRGEDLRKRIERSRGLPLDEVVLILSQASKALARAHELQIVHRDIKPENIFLTQEGAESFVKVLDFGIAKRVAHPDMEVTDHQSVFGTPYYMSPEQAMSTANVDHRADLWALAVVTYQMLTGERPFVGGTPGAVYVQINAGTYGRPSTFRPELPVAVDEWFKVALNRDLEARFSSALEMAEAFRLAVSPPAVSQRAQPRVREQENTREQEDTSEADSESIRTEVASARTVHLLNPKRPRLALYLLVVLSGAVAAIWSLLPQRRPIQHADLPSAALIPELPVERTAGLVRVPPEREFDAVREHLRDAGSVIATVPSSASSAQPPPRRVKGKGGSVDVSRSPLPAASAEQRPIKDRGF